MAKTSHPSRWIIGYCRISRDERLWLMQTTQPYRSEGEDRAIFWLPMLNQRIAGPIAGFEPVPEREAAPDDGLLWDCLNEVREAAIAALIGAAELEAWRLELYPSADDVVSELTPDEQP